MATSRPGDWVMALRQDAGGVNALAYGHPDYQCVKLLNHSRQRFYPLLHAPVEVPDPNPVTGFNEHIIPSRASEKYLVAAIADSPAEHQIDALRDA